jgi:hypothetical protein
MSDMSRRRLLKMAGGITFLALAPNGRGAFAIDSTMLNEKNPLTKATDDSGKTLAAPLPLFTALPYIQPGAKGTTLRDGDESIVIAWQTDRRPSDFQVIVRGKGLTPTAIVPKRSERFSGDMNDGEGRFDYAAIIEGLSLSTRYDYRVVMNSKTIAEGFFTTRKKRGTKTRFVTFGDNSYGEISDRMIAYQAYQAKPDFIMNTGDNVYEDGLDNEYARFFFPVYNADIAHPRVGAPLLRSVPYYTVIANHDVHGKDEMKRPVADFKTNPDSGGYFTCMHLPGNGHDATQKTPIIGPKDRIDLFRQTAGDRFPRQATYSFDYGDAHFLCLDSNIYVDANDPALHRFIEEDLKATDASWKFVVFHHPAFNVGYDHYSEQHMRVLSPIFEKNGVNIVLHGHEHNYQRTLPFTFAPSDISAASTLNTKSRLVPGKFTIDRAFDGVKNTKANGVIYITTGAGGKHLYDMEDNDKPERWKHKEDDYADYIARFISDRHSLTVVDMDAGSLNFKQVDQWGNVIDQFRLTK